MDCTVRSSTVRNALLRQLGLRWRLFSAFLKPDFLKRPTGGLVDQEAHFVTSTKVTQDAHDLPCRSA